MRHTRQTTGTMKRLQEFVESLERDELLEMKKLVKERYREKAARLMRYFQEFGRDIWIHHILERVSRMVCVSDLVILRLVSKDWNLFLREVTHVNMLDIVYHQCLKNHFPLVNSITTNLEITGTFEPLWQRIKTLEIVAEGWFVKIRDFSKWTSLETLVLADSFGSLEGLETLTSLTHLECHGDAFLNQDDIFCLKNLVRLSVRDLVIDSVLSKKLPKLNHLVSNDPRHFVGFTGSGRLKTLDLCPDDYDYDKELYLVMRREFDFYLKNADYLDLRGKWENGLFTGSCFITFQGIFLDTLSGMMNQGKINGSVTLTSYKKHIVYKGLFLNGEQCGVGEGFRIDRELNE